MKKLIILAIFLFAPLLPAQSFMGQNFTPYVAPTFSYIGSATGTCSSSVTACAASSTINAASGNLIFVWLRHGTVVTCPQDDTVTDSAGNSFNEVRCFPDSVLGVMEVFVATVTAASATDTVTVNYTAGRSFTDMIVRQYSGLGAIFPQMDLAFGTASQTTSSFTTSRQYEIAVQCNTGNTGTTWAAGSIGGVSASNLTAVDLSACQDVFFSSKQAGITGTITPTGGEHYLSELVTLASPALRPAQQPLTPLTFTTYDGSGQVVHPSVQYFPSGWNGFNYWIVAEPYPNGDASFENPSIWASNDGTTWVVPAGLTNPVSGTPTTGNYFNDGELYYDSATNEIWLYYLYTTSTDTSVLLRTSSDGITWSAASTVFTVTNFRILSPAVRKLGATYYMWSVNSGAAGFASTSNHLEVRTSSDGLTWSAPTTCNLVMRNGIIPWHVAVNYDSSRGEWVALISGYPSAQANANPESGLYLARSNDGTNWIAYPSAIVSYLSAHGTWDQGQTYRSTSIYDPTTDTFKLWYSASTKSDGAGTWGIGYLTTTFNRLSALAAWPQ